MYCASYTIDDTTIQQVVLRLPWVVVEPGSGRAPWHDSLQTAWSQLLQATTLDFAYRLRLDARRCERLLWMSGSPVAAGDLRRVADAFGSLNTHCEQTALRCATRADHDEAAEGVPSCLLRASDSLLHADERYLISDFRLFPLVEPVLLAALQAGWNVAYQVNVCRRAPSLELQRQVQKNLLAWTEEGALPDALLRHQTEVAARFGDTEFIVDEFFCCDGEPARRFITDTAEVEFRRRLGRIGFHTPAVECDADGEERDIVVTGLHRSRLMLLPPLATVGSAVTSPTLLQWLSWEPPRTWKAQGLANVKQIEGLPDLAGTTIINQGTLDLSVNKQVKHMSTANISVTLGNGVTIHGDFVVANRIKDSFTRAASAGKDELKTKLEELSTLIGKAVSQMPAAAADQASRDLQALVAEASSPQPRKRAYDLSAEGLLDAAKTVAEMAAPITTAVKAVISLLG